ncbi:peptidoglycan-binding domain-containing protein [Pseudomonas aeruginosa]
MVSDVDATVASTPKQQQREASSSSRQQSSPAARPGRQEQQPGATQQTYQAPAQPSDSSSAGKWLFGIVAVIGLIWLVNQSDNNSSSRSTYSPAPSSTSVAPTPAWQPPAAQPQAPSRPVEDQPSIGRNNVLSTAQIRYCLAEKIRLDAAESVINNYVESDVDRFNGYVNDYNSRCGEFRYRQGALESARRDVEPYRSQLQAEGRSRFVRSPSAATRSPTPAQTPQPVRPLPDATVQAIQQRLNELGYDAGPADGLPGERTRAAILAFQRDTGIAVDGVASQALLQNALVAERRAPSAAPIQLSRPERESLEAACSTDKYVNGPAAYRACIDRQTAALRAGVRRPNLSALSSAETQSIEAACSTDKYVNGPAAYNKCLSNQLASLSGQSGRPDLSRLSSSERQSIEAACSTDKYVNGPAAYNSCLNTQLVALDRQGSRPDLSRLSASDRRSIEAACSTDKYVNGPAAYNLCLSRQLARLRN